MNANPTPDKTGKDKETRPDDSALLKELHRERGARNAKAWASLCAFPVRRQETPERRPTVFCRKNY